ncbi:hypothetical protein [[Limnothrix rosea] IAM M-220]|uniref:hypothetical protein n=1 Tax=[Limnothrix rosea] IAM M-220 TaxID=454133 RepID=UPI00095D6016|nr:hypothetical protein [[Limnothrix rosea] IAM M-220]OKH13440.1 hypothetical protein NIES208_15005 [[Limnothrix rosea] IAM M-220]
MEPLSAIAITSLAFLATKAGEKALDKSLDAAWDKANLLRKKIWDKLRGNPTAENALTQAETGDEDALESVADSLKIAMREDQEFAEEVQQLAQQITQIDQMQGEIFNVSGGEVNFVKDNKSPVIQGGSGHQITFNINQSD